jgi:hypothetical protein
VTPPTVTTPPTTGSGTSDTPTLIQSDGGQLRDGSKWTAAVAAVSNGSQLPMNRISLALCLALLGGLVLGWQFLPAKRTTRR